MFNSSLSNNNFNCIKEWITEQNFKPEIQIQFEILLTIARSTFIQEIKNEVMDFIARNINPPIRKMRVDRYPPQSLKNNPSFIHQENYRILDKFYNLENSNKNKSNFFYKQICNQYISKKNGSDYFFYTSIKFHKKNIHYPFENDLSNFADIFCENLSTLYYLTMLSKKTLGEVLKNILKKHSKSLIKFQYKYEHSSIVYQLQEIDTPNGGIMKITGACSGCQVILSFNIMKTTLIYQHSSNDIGEFLELVDRGDFIIIMDLDVYRNNQSHIGTYINKNLTQLRWIFVPEKFTELTTEAQGDLLYKQQTLQVLSKLYSEIHAIPNLESLVEIYAGTLMRLWGFKIPSSKKDGPNSTVLLLHYLSVESYIFDKMHPIRIALENTIDYGRKFISSPDLLDQLNGQKTINLEMIRRILLTKLCSFRNDKPYEKNTSLTSFFKSNKVASASSTKDFFINNFLVDVLKNCQQNADLERLMVVLDTLDANSCSANFIAHLNAIKITLQANISCLRLVR